MSGIIRSDGLNLKAPKRLDLREGPWDSMADCLAFVFKPYRVRTLSPYILIDGIYVRHEWRDGVEDYHLVPANDSSNTSIKNYFPTVHTVWDFSAEIPTDSGDIEPLIDEDVSAGRVDYSIIDVGFRMLVLDGSEAGKIKEISAYTAPTITWVDAEGGIGPNGGVGDTVPVAYGEYRNKRFDFDGTSWSFLPPAENPIPINYSGEFLRTLASFTGQNGWVRSLIVVQQEYATYSEMMVDYLNWPPYASGFACDNWAIVIKDDVNNNGSAGGPANLLSALFDGCSILVKETRAIYLRDGSSLIKLNNPAVIDPEFINSGANYEINLPGFGERIFKLTLSDDTEFEVTGGNEMKSRVLLLTTGNGYVPTWLNDVKWRNNIEPVFDDSLAGRVHEIILWKVGSTFYGDYDLDE